MIDLSFLQQFSGGDKAKMSKYIGMFLKSYPSALQAIDDKLAAQDWSGLRTAAHSLKPQLNYMGAKTMQELAKEIEYSAGEGKDLEKLPGMVSDLKKGVVQVAALLEAELAKMG